MFAYVRERVYMSVNNMFANNMTNNDGSVANHHVLPSVGADSTIIARAVKYYIIIYSHLFIEFDFCTLTVKEVVHCANRSCGYVRRDRSIGFYFCFIPVD